MSLYNAVRSVQRVRVMAVLHRVVVGVGLFLVAATASADERTLELTVRDPSGRPLEGARVVPRGVSSRTLAVTWIGSPAEATTDAGGVARFTFPGDLAGNGPIVRLMLSIDHPRFVPSSDDLPIDGEGGAVEAASVTLKAGRELTIELVPLDGEATAGDCTVIVPGAGVRGVVKTRVEEGRLITRPLPATMRMSNGVPSA